MRDDFERLMEAIVRLQDCIRDMGPNAELVEILLKPNSACRHEVECALKMSPSYPKYMIPIDRALPKNVVCEMMGVKVAVVPL